MSEEEKEAINSLKQFKTILISNNSYDEIQEAIDIVIDLIDTQQFEIKILESLTKQSQDDVKIWKITYEELKEENRSLKKEIKLMKSLNINENYISKDIIRNKINELEEFRDSAVTWKLWHRVNSNIHTLEELIGDEDD